ncbi:MAG: hypothetical protein NWE89_17510 [Candidatus Bathyarchaeota archaeon]|nr:hypothetical protein [Candidatus Bathyarchaeota archaeon]
MGIIFSIEMESKQHVMNISISDKGHDKVLFEGDLGEHEAISIVNDRMIEINASNGVLRLELNIENLRKVLDA